MTQLYSNLVKYVNNTTYLCLVLAVLCSLVVSSVRLASLHTGQHQWMNGSPKPSHVQLSRCPLFIVITENKGGSTHGFKTKNLLYSMEV